MSDVSGAITNSAILITCLQNEPFIDSLAEHQEMTTAKRLHCHVKTLYMNVRIGVLVNNEKFPEYDIVHEEHLSNVDIDPTGMFDLKDAKYEFVQVLWVAKNQLLRSRRFLEVQLLDIT